VAGDPVDGLGGNSNCDVQLGYYSASGVVKKIHTDEID